MRSGTPIRSASLNFTPGRSWAIVKRTSTPWASNCSYNFSAAARARHHPVAAVRITSNGAMEPQKGSHPGRGSAAQPRSGCVLRRMPWIPHQRDFPAVGIQTRRAIAPKTPPPLETCPQFTPPKIRRLSAARGKGLRGTCAGHGIRGKSRSGVTWPEWSRAPMAPAIRFCVRRAAASARSHPSETHGAERSQVGALQLQSLFGCGRRKPSCPNRGEF